MSKVNRRKFITAAVGGAIVVASGYGYYQYSKRPASTVQSLAVSPTETLTTTSPTGVENRPPFAAFASGICIASSLGDWVIGFLGDCVSPCSVSLWTCGSGRPHEWQ